MYFNKTTKNTVFRRYFVDISLPSKTSTFRNFTPAPSHSAKQAKKFFSKTLVNCSLLVVLCSLQSTIKMPLNKPAQKEHARYLYFTTASTQKEIAKTVGIDPKTLYRWIHEGNWETEKEQTYFSPDRETHYLYEELREIDNNIRGRAEGLRYGTKEELDTKAKILNLIMGPLKNTADKWRNITPLYTVDEKKESSPEKGGFRGYDIFIEGIDPRDVPDL